MNSGKLNRRVQIQSQTTSQDAVGQELQSWATVYTCWASIDVQRSQLIYSTAEFISKVTHRVTIRYTSGVLIAANQHIVFTEPTTGVIHTFEIQAVMNTVQANRELVILCYELNPQE